MSVSYKKAGTTAMGLVTSMVLRGFPEAIVAGGYLRDAILGFEPKDIDIFITTQPIKDTDSLAAVLSAAIGVPMRAEYNLSYANMEVRRVFTSTPEGDELPIQVIELDKDADPVSRVNEHDFGLCQVWCNRFGVKTSPAFARDWNAGTCTLVHCESEAEHKRSIRRWARLSQKLVGYTLVDNTPWAGGVQLELEL